MQDRTADPLLQPLKFGNMLLPNRVLMAPLTRSRAQHHDDAPHALNAHYYAQRASAGLILSEATQISPQGKGYAYTPGIYSEAQLAGWQRVTQAVHAAGGRIFAQLWHVGRISHVALQPEGDDPVAPSALRAEVHTYLDDARARVPVSTPRALREEELGQLVEAYHQAAKNARAAGFDGVELHGANGYLIQQFLSATVNQREDAYGGSVANRIRLPLAIVEALIDVWGSERVGVRISPGLPSNDMSEPDADKVYPALIDGFNHLGVLFIDVVERMGKAEGDPALHAALREQFNGYYLANGGYDADLARAALRADRADAVIFGRPFIANPDLPERMRRGGPYNTPDPSTFYGGDARGYTDYPPLPWEA